MNEFCFSSYYKFERLPDSKSASRYDCTAIGGERNAAFDALIETPRNKARYIYVNQGHRNLKVEPLANSVLSLDKNKNHISRVYAYGGALQGGRLRGYGDIKGTKDAIVIEVSPDGCTLEVFISPNNKAIQTLIYEAFTNDSIATEQSADALRAAAERV